MERAKVGWVSSNLFPIILLIRPIFDSVSKNVWHWSLQTTSFLKSRYLLLLFGAV